MTTYWCEQAWLPDGVADDVRVEIVDGRFGSVQANQAPHGTDRRLPGFVLPGLANAHSHAFHRALRGRTHADGGTFWTWREVMYRLAHRLTPENYENLAAAVFAEMSLAGVTCVGEFHYVHHAPGGQPYGNPHAMTEALMSAAQRAAVRLTLLDTCYLQGGLEKTGHQQLNPVQQRFSDGSVHEWMARQSERPPAAHVIHGAAIHSIRAVREQDLTVLAQVHATKPVHAHVSEQPAENAACEAFYGKSPVALLSEYGFEGPKFTAVHATHLSERDIASLGSSSTGVCACPSTEADLADGIGPFLALKEAGARLCVGTDQHVISDPMLESTLVEWYTRLSTGRRGTFSAHELIDMATVQGHQSLGWHDAGRIAPGQRADLVAMTPTASGAGVVPPWGALAPGTWSVATVIRDGDLVVDEGHHALGDVGHLLTDAIAALEGDQK